MVKLFVWLRFEHISQMNVSLIRLEAFVFGSESIHVQYKWPHLWSILSFGAPDARNKIDFRLFWERQKDRSRTLNSRLLSGFLHPNGKRNIRKCVHHKNDSDQQQWTEWSSSALGNGQFFFHFAITLPDVHVSPNSIFTHFYYIVVFFNFECVQCVAFPSVCRSRCA